MKKETFDKFLKISEDFFGSQTDPSQIPINEDSRNKLRLIHPDTLIYKVDENENPIGWTVTIPTSIEVMRKFVNNEITEKELLDIAVAEKKFDALYLCATFVLPEFRGKGHAKEMRLRAIHTLSQGRDIPLYCWIYSDEGKKLVESVSKTFGKHILNRLG
jgi:predicted GNAT family acetyltransferase